MEMWMKRFGIAGLSLAGVVAVAAGRAPDEDEAIAGSFDQPINQSGQATVQSRMVSTVIDGGDSFTVVTENGKTTVQKNGEKLKKSQYRVKNNQIEILDDSGNVSKTIPMPASPKVHRFSFNTGHAAPPAPPAAPGNQTKIVVRGTPKVMLGVTMADADPEVLEQIGVDDGGVMIMSVSEDLPAAKAGLKAHDVVVEADGKALGGEQALREILKTKNPGDQVSLKVFRDGKAQTLNVTLEAFDSSKLNMLTTVTRNDSTTVTDSQEIDEMLQGVEQQVRSQIEALKSQLSETDWNKVRDQVTAALGDAAKQLEEARKQAAEAGATGMRWWQEHGQNLQLPRGFVQFTPPPATPGTAAPRPDVSDKLDRLSEQLERMNKRLDAMEKQIEKK